MTSATPRICPLEEALARYVVARLANLLNMNRTDFLKFGMKSDTTISSYDELQTPKSNGFSGFDFQISESKPVEGPVGPHLFRISQDSYRDVQPYLSMSPPATPKDLPLHIQTAIPQQPAIPVSHTRAASNPENLLSVPSDDLDLRHWTPQQVADWMYASGFDDSVVEKFETNDISGAILMDLQFEDLKELGIQSFGKRHRLWNEIRNIRGVTESPAATPIEAPPRGATRSVPIMTHGRRHNDCSLPVSPEDDLAVSPTGRRRRLLRHQHGLDDVISPAESVSIVAIEQLLPKPHKCSKGENCSKWQKQQRKLAKLAREFPIESQQGRKAFVTAEMGNASPASNVVRPPSEVVPSVVASSDILGPGQLPALRLDEDKLRVLQTRDPQENVRQFLSFQHMDHSADRSFEEPTTPPYEMFPALHSPTNTRPHENLRSLPKLTIPATRPASAFAADRTVTPSHIYRQGTPCSEMDVPITAIPDGPVARETSQSVPPDMRFGSNQIRRTFSRSEPRRQPNFPLARLDEHRVVEPVDYPGDVTPNANDINHAGWMKKRKTKMLRHEWHDHHFTLKGTQLAMHRDEKSLDALECIDVDEYAVACSSLASNKLGAAFKSLGFSGKKKELDPAAFSFQLVPAAEKKGILGAATGKAHHFAVKTRDQRIDWMRHLMIAKALKQRGDGYEVNVNGNMI